MCFATNTLTQEIQNPWKIVFVNCVTLHMLQFKFAKNVVGDCRLSMRPENLEMKFNRRALNYSVESLQPVLEPVNL